MFISVPSGYTLFEVKEEFVHILENGDKVLPPVVILEVMALNGQAKKIGMIGTITFAPNQGEEEDHDHDDDEPAGMEGLWPEE